MKKILLLVVLVSLSITSYAQKPKFATLRVMYESKKSDTPKAEASTSFGLAGGVGILLTDNFSAAMELGYMTADADKSNTVILKPSVRYTWWLTEKIGVFTGLGFPYTTKTSNIDPIETKTISYGASVMPGIMFFPFKRIAFDVSFDSMNYTKTDISVNGVKDSVKSGTSFNAGFSAFGSPNVTVYYVF